MIQFSEVTAENLRAVRSTREMTQKAIAELLGIPETAVSHIEKGKRSLAPAEKQLLDLFFFGRLPEGVIRQSEDLGKTLDFTEQEWKIVEVLARRHGQSPAEWIRSKILDYLAFAPESGVYRPTLQPLPLAAETPHEPGKIIGQDGAGGAAPAQRMSYRKLTPRKSSG